MTYEASSPINQPALRAAIKSSLKHPDWLKKEVLAYSSSHRCRVTVLEVLGDRVLAQKGSETVQLEQRDLSPITGETTGLEGINNANFRAVAATFADEISAASIIPGQSGHYTPLPETMSAPLRSALQSTGIRQFYLHQTQAWTALAQGQSLALVTPTSSGKTNCFVPRAFHLALEEQKTSLFIYPLRALALDQYEKVQALNNALPASARLRIVRCTGDVPLQERKRYFQGTRRPDIILISPDVLHHQLYRTGRPNMLLWQEYLEHLALVVGDESHSYTSSFGIHFANVLRRLRLACNRLGNKSDLSWVISTATISNPVELASVFSGQPSEKIVLINRSGAQSYERTLLILKPQSAPNFITASLLTGLMAHGLKGLTFVNSRRTAKQIFSLLSTGGAANVDLFYGSLLPWQRKTLIRKLSDSALSALITTSALEAGLDLPDLDFVLLRGSNSLNSLWQRAGRCGRKNPGLVIFIPSASNHIDYYYAKEPERLFGPVEKIKLQPNYPPTLAKHLLCGGAEGGITSNEVTSWFGPGSDRAAGELVRQGQLHWSRQGILWCRGYPHKTVALRGMINKTIALKNQDSEETLEEMPLDVANKECHTGAIYLTSNEGETVSWRCQSLNTESGIAYLKPAQNPKRLTLPEVNLKVNPTATLDTPKIITTSVDEGNLRLSLFWGTIHELVPGYLELEATIAPTCTNRSCRSYHQPQSEEQSNCKSCYRKLSNRRTTKIVEQVNFDAPLETTFDAPIARIEVNQILASALGDRARMMKASLLKVYKERDLVPEGLASIFETEPVFLALHSVTHLLAKAVPLLLLASDQDINSLTVQRAAPVGTAHQSIAYIYDAIAEGCGTTEALFEDFLGCVSKAATLAKGCDCQMGCPRCLTAHGCPQRNEALSKELGLWLLEQINA